MVFYDLAPSFLQAYAVDGLLKGAHCLQDVHARSGRASRCYDHALLHGREWIPRFNTCVRGTHAAVEALGRALDIGSTDTST
jgi:hypothetical protein